MWYSQSKDELLFYLSAQLSRRLLDYRGKRKWPPQMGTATLDTRVTFPKLTCYLYRLSLTDWQRSRRTGAQNMHENAVRFSSVSSALVFRFQ